MCTRVGVQIAGTIERLATHVARVRFNLYTYVGGARSRRTHRCMRQTMSCQIAWLTEGASAVFTFERLLAGVYALQK